MGSLLEKMRKMSDKHQSEALQQNMTTKICLTYFLRNVSTCNYKAVSSNFLQVPSIYVVSKLRCVLNEVVH